MLVGYNGNEEYQSGEKWNMKRLVVVVVIIIALAVALVGINFLIGFPVYTVRYLLAENFNQYDLVVCPYVEDPATYTCNVKLGQEFVLSDFFQKKEAGFLTEKIGGCWRENKFIDSNFAEKTRVLYSKNEGYLSGLDKAEVYLAKKIGETIFKIDQCCGKCYPIEAKINIVN